MINLRTSPIVWWWLNLATSLVPSTSRIWSDVVGCEGSMVNADPEVVVGEIEDEEDEVVVVGKAPGIVWDVGEDDVEGDIILPNRCPWPSNGLMGFLGGGT